MFASNVIFKHAKAHLFAHSEWFQVLLSNTNNLVCINLNSFKYCYVKLIVKFDINQFVCTLMFYLTHRCEESSRRITVTHLPTLSSNQTSACLKLKISVRHYHPHYVLQYFWRISYLAKFVQNLNVVYIKYKKMGEWISYYFKL